MEVEGDNNEKMNIMMGKEIDKKLNKAKAKEKREKRKKLFGRRQKPTAGADKNWSEWQKRHKQRWKRKAVLIKKEMEEGFLQRDRALPEKEPSSRLCTITGTTTSHTTTVDTIASRAAPGTTTTTTTSTTAATDAPTPS